MMNDPTDSEIFLLYFNWLEIGTDDSQLVPYPSH